MSKKDIYTILIAVTFSIFVLYILAYPNEVFKAAYDGLQLWFNVVFPALLPFFICVEILIGLGIVSFLGSCFKAVMRPIFNLPGEGSFAFFMSIASGYPVGAKITAALLQSNVCTRVEAQRMLSLCSTSGPLFIIGAVATGILHNPKLGILLAAAHYLSALTSGILMRSWGNKSQTKRAKTPFKLNRELRGFSPIRDMLEYKKKDDRSLGLLMGDAVKNSVNLILTIGGFIILFSVIAAVLKVSGLLYILSSAICTLLPFLKLNPQAVSGLLIGLLEVTNGIKECALVEMPLVYKMTMISFMIGFGGLSINAQVLSLIAGTKLRFGLYTLVKVVQGAAAALYTYILYGLVGTQQVFFVYNSLNVNQYVRYINSSMLSKLGSSITNLVFVLLFMLTSTLFFRYRKLKLSNKVFKLRRSH